LAKIVVITSRFPFPLEKGDKLRIFNQVKYFSKNHEVYLLTISHETPSEEQITALRPYCKSLITYVIPLYKRHLGLIGSIFSRKPFQVQYFYSKSVKRKIEVYINEIQPDVIYSHLIRTSEYVSQAGKISKTLDYMDCFSKGFKLKISTTKNPLSRFLYMIEFKRLLRYERNVFDKFNHHVIISDQDRQAIDHSLKSKIEVISNGVDFNIFYPVKVNKKYDLVFSGNMGYPPNIDAAYFAATKILPILMNTNPNIKLLIAGMNAPLKLKNLRSKNIEVIEHFDHIRYAFAESIINLVPVITSIGLQNKILQAMAMKIPTVTTLAGARGINAEKDNVLLIGETAEELVAHIHNLLGNESERNFLAERAYEFVHQKFSWSIHNEKLLQKLFE